MILGGGNTDTRIVVDTTAHTRLIITEVALSLPRAVQSEIEGDTISAVVRRFNKQVQNVTRCKITCNFRNVQYCRTKNCTKWQKKRRK